VPTPAVPLLQTAYPLTHHPTTPNPPLAALDRSPVCHAGVFAAACRLPFRVTDLKPAPHRLPPACTYPRARTCPVCRHTTPAHYLPLPAVPGHRRTPCTWRITQPPGPHLHCTPARTGWNRRVASPCHALTTLPARLPCNGRWATPFPLPYRCPTTPVPSSQPRPIYRALFVVVVVAWHWRHAGTRLRGAHRLPLPAAATLPPQLNVPRRIAPCSGWRLGMQHNGITM